MTHLTMPSKILPSILILVVVFEKGTCHPGHFQALQHITCKGKGIDFGKIMGEWKECLEEIAEASGSTPSANMRDKGKHFLRIMGNMCVGVCYWKSHGILSEDGSYDMTGAHKFVSDHFPTEAQEELNVELDSCASNCSSQFSMENSCEGYKCFGKCTKRSFVKVCGLNGIMPAVMKNIQCKGEKLSLNYTSIANSYRECVDENTYDEDSDDDASPWMQKLKSFRNMCVHVCSMKKQGLLTDNGDYNTDEAHKFIEDNMSGKSMEEMKKAVDECASKHSPEFHMDNQCQGYEKFGGCIHQSFFKTCGIMHHMGKWRKFH